MSKTSKKPRLSKAHENLLLRFQQSRAIQNGADDLLQGCVQLLDQYGLPYNKNYNACPTCQTAIVNEVIRLYNRESLWSNKKS